jgi:protein-S-isoprenylcysteine O-methyltransferase Ste14
MTARKGELLTNGKCPLSISGHKELHMGQIAVVLWTIARVTTAVLIVGWAVLRLRFFDGVFGVTLPQWVKPVGVLLLAIGGLVVLLCGALLRTPGVLPMEFVVTGPFRYTRNPMSLGAVTMACGLALFCRSISILIFAGILFLGFHAVVVFLEEPGLEKRYGESYRHYKHSVNRWLPSFRSR